MTSVSAEKEEYAARMNQLLDTYSKEEMASCLGHDHALPSPQFPSDHLSLCCDFQLLHT